MQQESSQYIENLKEKLPVVEGKYEFNVPLAKMTWFGVGGNADVIFYPRDIDDLSNFLVNKPSDLDVFVLGGGSNILIRDGGFRGVVVKLDNHFSYIEKEDNVTIKVGCGTLNSKLFKFCFNNSIGGFEFLGTIPGSVGGAVRMNAGCHGHDVSQILVSAKAVNLKNGDIVHLNNEDFGFVYRGNNLPDNLVFVEAEFKGYIEDQNQIQGIFDDYVNRRRATQPMGVKTCGSTFKNPAEAPAWKLIEEAGFKGYKLGGAKVSEQHSNFFINEGNATADDIESLGEMIRKTIKEKEGVELEWEVQRVGEKLEEQITENPF